MSVGSSPELDPSPQQLTLGFSAPQSAWERRFTLSWVRMSRFMHRNVVTRRYTLATILLGGIILFTWVPDAKQLLWAITLPIIWLLVTNLLLVTRRMGRVSIPEQLAKSGVTDDRVQQMIVSELEDFSHYFADSFMPGIIEIVPPPELTLPGAKLSLEKVSHLVAYLLQRRPAVIQGSITSVGENRFEVSFESPSEGRRASAGVYNTENFQSSEGLSMICKISALTIIRLVSPFHAAVIAFRLDMLLISKTIAVEAIKYRKASRKTLAACWSIIGLLLLLDGRLNETAKVLRKAESLDQTFPLTLGLIYELLKENYRKHGYRPNNKPGDSKEDLVLNWYKNLSGAPEYGEMRYASFKLRQRQMLRRHDEFRLGLLKDVQNDVNSIKELISEFERSASENESASVRFARFDWRIGDAQSKIQRNSKKLATYLKPSESDFSVSGDFVRAYGRVAGEHNETAKNVVERSPKWSSLQQEAEREKEEFATLMKEIENDIPGFAEERERTKENYERTIGKKFKEHERLFTNFAKELSRDIESRIEDAEKFGELLGEIVATLRKKQEEDESVNSLLDEDTK